MIPTDNPTVTRLLALMDQKHHWAYPALTKPGLTRDQLLVHFRHEYATYVRDFPVLLARAMGQVPPLPDVRHALAENLYEEQTGGLSKSDAHPELFLRLMEGLGFSRDLFDDSDLCPAAESYKTWLMKKSASEPWQAAVALLTIFVEGSVNERAELAGTYKRLQGEEAVKKHPLVLHYGCPPSAMQLTRAHGDIEGSHRADAWRILITHVTDAQVARAVVETCMDALARWQRYRDGVAERMGLSPADTATPPKVASR
ncbi:MAG: iron-containing redox enzyme family protein [Myxococcales bacterium]|nr:iron-containing redox enzyme family protein [Myxococcales bacterium]